MKAKRKHPRSFTFYKTPIALFYKLSSLIGEPLRVNNALIADDGKANRSIS